MSNKFDKAFQHENSKGQEVQTGQRLRQLLVITGQAAEAGSPGKTTFNYPTAVVKQGLQWSGEDAARLIGTNE